MLVQTSQRGLGVVQVAADGTDECNGRLDLERSACRPAKQLVVQPAVKLVDMVRQPLGLPLEVLAGADDGRVERVHHDMLHRLPHLLIVARDGLDGEERLIRRMCRLDAVHKLDKAVEVGKAAVDTRCIVARLAHVADPLDRLVELGGHDHEQLEQAAARLVGIGCQLLRLLGDGHREVLERLDGPRHEFLDKGGRIDLEKADDDDGLGLFQLLDAVAVHLHRGAPRVDWRRQAVVVAHGKRARIEARCRIKEVEEARIGRSILLDLVVAHGRDVADAEHERLVTPAAQQNVLDRDAVGDCVLGRALDVGGERVVAHEGRHGLGEGDKVAQVLVDALEEEILGRVDVDKVVSRARRHHANVGEEKRTLAPLAVARADAVHSHAIVLVLVLVHRLVHRGLLGQTLFFRLLLGAQLGFARKLVLLLLVGAAEELVHLARNARDLAHEVVVGLLLRRRVLARDVAQRHDLGGAAEPARLGLGEEA